MKDGPKVALAGTKMFSESAVSDSELDSDLYLNDGAAAQPEGAAPSSFKLPILQPADLRALRRSAFLST